MPNTIAMVCACCVPATPPSKPHHEYSLRLDWGETFSLANKFDCGHNGVMRHQTTRGRSITEKLERQQARRKQRDMLFLVLLALGVVMLLLVVEIGRAYFCMQEVGRFAENINTMPPAEVKREVQRFADKLGDRNPLIRNSAISAMKLATGWRIGPNAAEWLSWWNVHRDQWEYRPHWAGDAQSVMEQAPPWKDLIPPHLLQTAAPPTTATSNLGDPQEGQK
jgi:predicted nucleic acid-binding Zn ribbon protein